MGNKGGELGEIMGWEVEMSGEVGEMGGRLALLLD